jgi:hypothetical protein
MKNPLENYICAAPKNEIGHSKPWKGLQKWIKKNVTLQASYKPKNLKEL